MLRGEVQLPERHKAVGGEGRDTHSLGRARIRGPARTPEQHAKLCWVLGVARSFNVAMGVPRKSR
eukprot:4441307-Pyramimonas_sp.AAC.1